MPPRIEHVERLDADRRVQVTALIASARTADHVGALSEHAMLRLGHETPAVRHLLALDDHRLVGYAQLDLGDAAHAVVAELVVDPDARRRGFGRALGDAALAATPDGRLQVWAHGDHPAAQRLADRLGLAPVRTLWQLHRRLAVPLPAAALPDGVTVRTFRPGVDDDAWVALNARAFATHPEQGRWTVADLHHRTAEAWFDPAGFFLAERADPRQLVGFHWTKVHAARAGEPPVGEVYVVGVDPAEQGHGLGRALTLVGLEHLQQLGLDEVMLYVDADNAAGMRLYDSLGFTRHRTDVLYGT